MPVPTRRLALVTAVVAAVLLVVPGDVRTRLLIGNLVVLALAVIDWALAPPPARVAVERRLPGVLALGQRGTIEWRLRNPLSRPLHVAVADELAPSLRAGSRRAALRLPPHGGSTATTHVVPARRGRFEITEMVVRVLGPFGLVARQRARRVPGELRVYPPFRSRQEAELRIDKARILEVGLRSAKGRGGGTEFDQLRDYTVDDEFRHRLGGDRPVRQAHRAHLPRRAKPDRADPARQRTRDGRPGRRRTARRARHGRRDDADHDARPVWVTAAGWWRSTGGSARL